VAKLDELRTVALKQGEIRNTGREAALGLIIGCIASLCVSTLVHTDEVQRTCLSLKDEMLATLLNGLQEK